MAHVHTALLVKVALLIMRVILLLNDSHAQGLLSFKFLGVVDFFLAAIAELQDRDDSGDRQALKWVPIIYDLIACFFLDILVKYFSLQSFWHQLPALVEQCLSKVGYAVHSPSYIYI